MKVAKLPNGKTLKFPDGTPDDAIDETVRTHLKEHTNKIESEKKEKEQNKQEFDQKHQELLQGLGVVAQLLHYISQQNVQGHATVMQELQNHTHALAEHGKILNKPKRMKAIRDGQGKIIGSEEH